jgi:lysophospholipase L1-like esterase
VRFDFYTNSDFIKLKYCNVQEGAPGVFYSFDVYLDDKLIYTHFSRNQESDEGEFTVKLECDGRVRVFFPNLSSPEILSVELADGSRVLPFLPQKKLLCFGDSITQGYYAVCPSCSYVNRLAQYLKADLRNIGVGAGHFFDGAITVSEDFDPDIITVAYGTNDWNGDRVLFEPRCKAFMKKLAKLYGGKEIYVILPIWRPDYKEVKEKTGDFFSHCDSIRKEAERYGFNVTYGLDLMPHDEALCVCDGLHPNDAGFAHYALNLYKKIQK